jgi:hypothetical protein
VTDSEGIGRNREYLNTTKEEKNKKKIIKYKKIHILIISDSDDEVNIIDDKTTIELIFPDESDSDDSEVSF